MEAWAGEGGIGAGERYNASGAYMATKVSMPVEDYLRTSFEGPDCEYLDGEIVERNMGEKPHGRVQAMLAAVLFQLEARLGIEVITDIRIQITAERYRVADLAVWRAGTSGPRFPVNPPFLAIEILSPEDRMVRMQPKIQEYLSIGVEWVWVIDPEEKAALCYSRQNPCGTLCETLRTKDPAIEIALDDVFRQAGL